MQRGRERRRGGEGGESGVGISTAERDGQCVKEDLAKLREGSAASEWQRIGQVPSGAAHVRCPSLADLLRAKQRPWFRPIASAAMPILDACRARSPSKRRTRSVVPLSVPRATYWSLACCFGPTAAYCCSYTCWTEKLDSEHPLQSAKGTPVRCGLLVLVLKQDASETLFGPNFLS
jgi:hypothetical protein